MPSAPLLNTVFAALALSLGACAGAPSAPPVDIAVQPPAAMAKPASAAFEADRAAILQMAGDFKVTFDFTETVSFVEGYELKPQKLSGGHEVVRVIEDRGDFISLQHILVVGGDEKFPVKHWRQDWQYEPSRILTFIGGNAWAWRDVPEVERAGKWSQTVYQVDDAPRYSAVAAWTYENGLAEWAPPHEWRPLPRRDMTTRDDYHAVDAVNRHVITPWGWVHEQDNDKLVLSGDPRVQAREVGVNTYRRDGDFAVEVATEYWSSTEAFWADIRDTWTEIASDNPAFAIRLKGETETLYTPLLELAEAYAKGEVTREVAATKARAVIAEYVTPFIGALETRLNAPESLPKAP